MTAPPTTSGAHRWTEIVWVDLLGRPHTVRVRADRDRAVPVTVERRRLLAGHGPAPDVEGTLVLVPDPASVRQHPWEPDVDVVMADLHEPDGGPSALCSRSVLRRVLSHISAAGYDVLAAAELEFFLLRPGTGRPLYDEIEQYSITKGAEIEAVMAPVRNDLRRMDIPVEASNPEYSGGQVEVNVEAGDGLTAADRATLLRMMVSRLARRAGLEATFMAKPWTDQAGNGMHVHQSLWADGRNAFADGNGGLSPTGRSWAAGLLAHMADLTLFGSPTPNGYHRRADLSFAPTVLCWGADNRTLAVRAITGSERATRLEQRDASADANVYLTLAGQLSAGHDGLEQALEPPDTVTGNAYGRRDLPVLPLTFLDAYASLQRSDAARRFIGKATVETFLELLEPERELAITSSADWERDRYLYSI